MPTSRKTIAINPPKLAASVAAGLRRAIEDPARHPDAYISLSASGGLHGEHYEFEYRIDAAGRVTSRLTDELKGRRHAERALAGNAVDPSRFVALARAIDVPALLRVTPVSGGFPPDSVVGRLEVGDGKKAATFLFLADDEQAPRSRAVAPAPLRKAAAAVYAAAAAYLGTADVKP